MLTYFDNWWWPKIISIRRTTIGCAMLVLTLVSTPLSATTSWEVGTSSQNALFFYNPESNLNDFRSLKMLFDRYLSDKGWYQFQPFNNKETFERFLASRKNGVFLLSSWHYQNLVEQQGYYNLRPILVGTIDGELTYTKVLSTKKHISNLKRLQGKRIASAGNQDYTKQMLENMVQQRQRVNRPFQVLTVPKDIDALMSVLFGMAQGALTARNSLDTLAALNPRKYRLLRQHLESQPILLPMVVVYEPVARFSTEKLLDAIENMPNNATGQAILGMLGLNGWKKLTPMDRRRLGLSR